MATLRKPQPPNDPLRTLDPMLAYTFTAMALWALAHWPKSM